MRTRAWRIILQTAKNLALSVVLLLASAPLRAGNVVRAGSANDPQHLDPARSWDDFSSFYIINIFDTLVRFDPSTRSIQPCLATDWSLSRDGRTWTFHLRRGVRFHDGTPFDADAVVFSFSRQMDPSNPDRLSEFPLFYDIFTHLQTVRKVNPYQVQFILSVPFSPFLSSLTADCSAIVSPTAVGKMGAAFDRQPVGTGPFKLSSWQKKKRLVLAANKGYWRGKPSIDEYITLIEPDGQKLIAYFQNGTIDMLTNYSISKMINYEKQDWIRIAAAPIFAVTYLVPNAVRPWLKKRGVRRALSHAWDPRALKFVFQNYVLPIHSLLPPGLAGDSEGDIPADDFSLAKAKALLKQEGVPVDLNFEILLPKNDRLFFQLMSIYSRNLSQIGVKLRLTRLEPEALAARIARDDFDLAYTGWIVDYPNPDCMLSPLFSEKLHQQGLPTITAGFRADLWKRLLSARRERDAKKSLAAYREIDRSMIDDGLVIPIFQDKTVVTFHRKLGAVPLNPLGKLFLTDIRIP